MSVFDKLLTSAPIDGTAKRVISRGASFEPKLNEAPTHAIWDAPPECQQRPKSAPDYSGIRRGRLVAFRYFQPHKKKGSQWLVRCDCGKYEVRNMANWVKSISEPDACRVCRRIFYITHGHTMEDKPKDRKTVNSAASAVSEATN